MPNQPTLVEFGACRFLIMDAPSENNLAAYVKSMQRYGVVALVRVCEPTYDKAKVEGVGIDVHDWLFPDGEGPPPDIILRWLQLCRDTFYAGGDAGVGGETEAAQACIAVHCVAGLGRAPVLVAICLIEHGVSPLDAVQFIRERRRGAINSRQLKFLESYRARHSDWFPPDGDAPSANPLQSSTSSTGSGRPDKRASRCPLQ